MSQPPQYDRQFNFQNQQSLTPADPIPADELDSELNSIKITLDATLANLASIQRDDGALGNDTVGVDQLKPELDNFAAASIAAIAAKVAAEAAAVAAANSASSASTSAMAADTAKTGAQSSEIAAEVAQAAAEAAAVIAEAAIGDMAGTSTTSNEISLGLKSFVTQDGKFFDTGSWLLVTSDAAPATDYMHGIVTAYVGTALVLNATTFGGSGAHTDWTIRVSGTQGAPGTPGADGAAGAPGIQFAFDSSTVDSDPGTGKFRFNDAVLSLVTALYVDNAEFNGTDVSAWLDGFDDLGSAADRGNLRIINPEAPTQLYIYKVTGSVVDGTGYRKLTIAHVSGTEALSVGAAFSFAMFPIGATGATGAPGSGATLADNDYGDIVVSGVGTILTIDSGVVTTAKMGGDVTTAGKALLDDASAGVQRTTLGVGTGDSPEFTAVNIGHASDTTLARSGVGDISVEGKGIYRADGTDVPVADGGSGRSTATAYAVLCGGTAATAAHQSVTAVGSAGELLTSNGAGTLPTFQAASGGGAPSIPQGRLTLSTGVPVMAATVAATGTLYYTPYVGNVIWLYDGSAWVKRTFSEMSIALSGGTASVPVDVFAYDNAGTVALEILAWTSILARATALVRQDGVLCKTGALTRRYLGSVMLDASKQAQHTFGSAAAGGGKATFSLWNMYNRVNISTQVNDTTASWAYNSATWRSANGNANNSVSFMSGLADDSWSAAYHGVVLNAASGFGYRAIGYDTASTPSGYPSGNHITSVSVFSSSSFATSSLGYHTANAIEATTAAVSCTFIGSSSGVLFSWLDFSFRY